MPRSRKLTHLLEKLGDWIIYLGLPVVHAYHLFCGSLFLNVVQEDAPFLEKAANSALAPVHYLFCAKKIEGEKLIPRFSYQDHFLIKTAVSCVAAPLSLAAGGTLKVVAFLAPGAFARYKALVKREEATAITSNHGAYLKMGIALRDLATAPFIQPPEHTRRPGDENHMNMQKEALKEIVTILRKNEIPFWVDCGTCLGAYRYGGIIPWDWDLDIAVLAPDFENIRHALNALDPEKYSVQDWSGRDCPGTYLKVYIKGTNTLIDLYHFSINSEKRMLNCIFSNEHSPFFPESWKIRERRYSVDTPLDVVFPLKRAYFDGIEVPIPGKTKEYLQLRYGENISPAKIYDPATGRYEKDLSHPYWKIAHVH